MSADLAAALTAVRQYGGADDRIVEDSADTLAYAWDVTDALAAVRDARPVVEAGGVVRVRLTVDADSTVLRSDAAGSWLAEEGAPNVVLPHLREAGPRAEWTTAELVGEGGIAAAGTVEVVFDKAPCRDAVEQEIDRSVWIGQSTGGFAAWLRDSVPEHIAERLFGRPGALALLADWTGAAVGDRLTVAGLDARPAGVEDDDVLVRRLESRGERGTLPRWRLLAADDAALPAAIREPLRKAVGLTAARLLAESDDPLRPSETESTVWALPATPGEASGDFVALTELVRWVAADLSEARLEVARHVAARRIEDAQHEAATDAILAAARLAYTLHVKSDVRESLDRQQQLEEAFRDLDDRVAEMRSKLAETLDGALTKALAGALAIGIAAVVTADVRDWPATIATFAVAGYLVISAVNVVHLRDDSTRRLDEAAALAGQRVEGFGDAIATSVAAWKTSLEGRARFVLAVLIVVAIAVAVAGIVQNSEIL